MPPLRILLIIFGALVIPCLLTFSTLLQAHPRDNAAADVDAEASQGNFHTFFSFRTPSTLFPPSAIISLTDDNSTFFLARPADFGPSLASDGLSGPLWIGSGFGDGAEGELGCSDVPGWDEASQQFRRELLLLEAVRNKESKDLSDGKQKRSDVAGAGVSRSEAVVDPAVENLEASDDDGTDDHLHHPLPSSAVSRPSRPGVPADHETLQNGQAATHADIQSLQESAEISGRVVLLSRGGCGFLEKVKWAQRRGATALIVGDHTRGGALVTMYARGDTSNVSIPSVFTSHTTAHLLASLIPTENHFMKTDDAHDSSALSFSGRLTGGRESDTKLDDNDRPTFTRPSFHKSTSKASSNSRSLRTSPRTPVSIPVVPKVSWLKTLFGRSTKSSEIADDNTRPPSSGRLDGLSPIKPEKVQKDNAAQAFSQNNKNNVVTDAKDNRRPAQHTSSNDDFVIGVQDWRDPDVVIARPSSTKPLSTSAAHTPLSTTPPSSKSGKESGVEGGSKSLLSGGIITPGSGQYQRPDEDTEKHSQAQQGIANEAIQRQSSGSKKEADESTGKGRNREHVADEHEGLWVTITPTTMSSSPFFDTLLVLVVSPLVTLTVVYALLLLRSRIRRRRWRAPKSVVERLPIRTYHTMSCSSTASSTRYTSPRNASPTSPQSHSSLCSLTRTRPRSATASGIGEAVTASFKQASKEPLAEKSRIPSNKKKYSGRQSECVVCLEEYVDGKSKVMSLPCGHEFHAECMSV